MSSGAAPAAAVPQYNVSELQTVTRQNLPLNAYEIQQPVQVVQPVQGQALQPVTVSKMLMSFHKGKIRLIFIYLNIYQK